MPTAIELTDGAVSGTTFRQLKSIALTKGSCRSLRCGGSYFILRHLGRVLMAAIKTEGSCQTMSQSNRKRREPFAKGW